MSTVWIDKRSLFMRLLVLS